MRATLIAWLWRYLPLEIMATVCALAGGLGMAALTGNGAAIALAATWAENAGFYGYALLREVRRRLAGIEPTMATVGPTLAPAGRALLLEFGPAEALDSFIVRPACLYVLPQLMGNLVAGLVVGKFLADVLFYGLAGLAHEWSKSKRQP